MKRSALLTLACFAFLLMASPARAAVVYTLNIDHFGGAGPAPYGTVTVTQFGAPANGVVDLTVSLTNGNNFVLTGQAGSTIAFNSLQNQTLALISPPAGWSLDNGGVAGTLGANGFGSFNYSINCCNNTQGGGASMPGPVTLRLSGTGLLESSFAELSTLPPGDTPAFFAVDVIGEGTGFVGSTTPGTPSGTSTNLPEPGITALLTLGMGMVGAAVRRRRAGR